MKSVDKPRVSIGLGSAGRSAATAGCAASRMGRESVHCGSCRFGERLEFCATVRSCAGVFSYFRDVVSYVQAEAMLVNGRDTLKFSGSAQCVAAFAILACMVYSECGRAAPCSFLLEHFCRVQGQGGDSAFFGKCRTLRGGSGPGAAPKPGQESWHELFDTLLRSKVVSVLDAYDNGGLNDTLRNACQILFSISSLALDETHPGRGATGSPGLT